MEYGASLKYRFFYLKPSSYRGFFNKKYSYGFESAQLSTMHLKKIAQPLQIFAVLPILTANFALPSQLAFVGDKAPAVVVSATVENGLLLKSETDNQQKLRDEKAQKIDKYFADRNLPLAGYGKKFVEEAEKNDLPWNLLPAIAMIESTGYKFACKNPSGLNNGFGWGSCKIKFKSIDEAIEVVAYNIGGNNPDTDHHYAGKDVEGILNTYNPPKFRKDYVYLVTKVMKIIENYELTD